MCAGAVRQILPYANNISLIYLWILVLVFNVRYTRLSEPEHVGWIVVVCGIACQSASALLWLRTVREEAAWAHLGYGFVCLVCSFGYMQDAAPRMLLALLLGANCALHWGMAVGVWRTLPGVIAAAELAAALHRQPPVERGCVHDPCGGEVDL